MDAASVSTNKLMVATVTGNPTLTFDQVTINATDGAALIIDGNFNLTLHTTGDNASALRSSGAFTATEGADPSITTIMRYNKTFAAIVTPGNTYRLWAVASADARIQQKGFDSEGTAIMQ